MPANPRTYWMPTVQKPVPADSGLGVGEQGFREGRWNFIQGRLGESPLFSYCREGKEFDPEAPVDQIALLKNTIQHYGWGSFSAIAELLGECAPQDRPQAELWMGAHPKAPSLVERGGKWVSILDVITQDPGGVLGENTAARFKNQLPYLFKVLAAAKPLSIQAHPNKVQAHEGFDREDRAGIPLDAPDRNYKDKNHKPEIICALSPFWALSGFRPIAEFLVLTEEVSLRALKKEVERLKTRPNPLGLEEFFHALLTLVPEKRERAIAETLEFASKRASGELGRWVARLHEEYPDDIGVLSPLVLNLVCLKPGEALFLPPGQLHAYLEGTGIELMANSDNVLRGGLTPKHVNVHELKRILSFASVKPAVLTPVKHLAEEWVYPTRAEEFELSVLPLQNGVVYESPIKHSVEILLCIEGQATIAAASYRNKNLCLTKGTSVIIPAAAGQYTLRGEARLYKARVPTFVHRSPYFVDRP